MKLRSEWSDFLDSLPPTPRIGNPGRIWTAEEDAFIIKARAAGATWDEVCSRIGCAQDTARKRLRLLKAQS